MKESSLQPLIRALQYVKKYWGYIAAGFICTLLVNAFTLYQPVLIKMIMDKVIFAGKTAAQQAEALKYLKIVIGGFILLLLGKGFFYYFQGYLLPCGVNKAVRDIRNETFQHIQRLPLKTFDKFRTGDLMTRITNDADRLSDVFGLGIINFINDIMILVCSLGFMFFKNWQMSLVVILVSPVVAGAIGRFSGYVKSAVEKNQKQMSTIYNTIEESITGIKTVKSFSMEKKEIARFERENSSLYGHIMKVIQYKVAQIPVVEVIAGVGISCAIGYGGLQIVKGLSGNSLGLSFIEGRTVGEIFEVWGYMIMATNPLNRISQSISTITGSAVSAQRIFEVLDSPQEETEKKPDMKEIDGKIEFCGVRFKYNQDQDLIINDLSFCIQKGETVALVGHSGSGKTTTASLIARLYVPDQGVIKVDDTDINSVNLHSYRSQLAIVPQETALFTGTIKDNILYGKDDASQADIEAAAKAANAHDFITDMPDGYDTVVGERGSTLSGGQRQRIAIARAIIKKPKILILDEATSSVDAISEKLIQESLDNIFDNFTTIIIAHRVSTIQKANKILVFDKGRIVECGNHTSLINAGGLYESLYKSYFKHQENES